MTYLLWQRTGDVRIASPRKVLRASEVPLLTDALALRQRGHLRTHLVLPT